MNQTFTHKQVTGYLGAHYLLSYRRGNKDFYYNYLNREFIPVLINKDIWTQSDIQELFLHEGIMHKSNIEFQRFTNYIRNT